MSSRPSSTRERLLAAAGELLDRGGPRTVTLREVGRLAGVSHNAPYKHFPDKASLLAAVAASHLDGLTKAIAGTARRSTVPEAALSAVGHAYVRWARTKPQRFRLAMGRWDVDDPVLAEAATAARRAFFRPFRDAASTGKVASAESAAGLVWAAAHGAVDLELSGHLRKDDFVVSPEALVDELVAVLTTS